VALIEADDTVAPALMLDDFDNLLAWAKKIKQFEKPVFKHFKEATARRSFVTTINFGFAKIVEHKGKLVGCMFGVVRENHWGERCAFDLMTYSMRETPKLLRLFKEWAEDSGADEVYITNTTGNERYMELIKKLGFVENSTIFGRSI